jgi:hypothetical protein
MKPQQTTDGQSGFAEVGCRNKEGKMHEARCDKETAMDEGTLKWDVGPEE